jgi:CRISPR-associated endonuclease/helicase Cas3
MADRFWRMNRHHGWWGIALLEAVVRIADQTASANPKFGTTS